ncbi:hypothetical protein [Pseudolysinimonas sp.]|uniref:hypothetical protein n=1 Tax=Pseudolysinimonas sp. TaxID=2680009 RepID=UPI003784FA05
MGVVLILLIRGMPTLCPAIDPAPPSCAPDARHAPALVALLVLLAVWAIAATLALLIPDPHPVLDAGSTGAVVVAALLGAGFTLVASGFSIPLLL